MTCRTWAIHLYALRGRDRSLNLEQRLPTVSGILQVLCLNNVARLHTIFDDLHRQSHVKECSVLYCALANGGIVRQAIHTRDKHDFLCYSWPKAQLNKLLFLVCAHFRTARGTTIGYHCLNHLDIRCLP